jgi:hypothetical protein
MLRLLDGGQDIARLLAQARHLLGKGRAARDIELLLLLLDQVLLNPSVGQGTSSSSSAGRRQVAGAERWKV